MIVCLDLHQDIELCGNKLIATASPAGRQEVARKAFYDRCIVVIGAQNPLTLSRCMRIADHIEETVRLWLIINPPIRSKNLMSAMLGIRLSEHH